ncbi:MAG: hypothetical protein IJU70_11090 [Lentisphaeria bacterium]|nr:hypothetical protein [Lentisphaeria bacterium]
MIFRRYFTLFEVVVAMMVMGVVAMIIGTAGATFYNGYRRSVSSVERLECCIMIDRIFDTLIRNAVPFKWPGEDNASRLVFDGTADTLLFTALRRSYGGDSGAIVFVRLFVEDDQLIAAYSSSPMLPWSEGDEQGVEREVIARNVASVTFQYAEFGEENSIDWQETWEEEEHDTLPLAVRMTVEWLDGRKEYWLRRTAGNSQESTFGYRALPTDEAQSGNRQTGGTRR